VGRETIKYFHKSHIGSAELDEKRDDLNISRGLVAIGKTRFATITLSFMSIQRCAPAIKAATASGKLDTFPHPACFRLTNAKSSYPPPRTMFFEVKRDEIITTTISLAKAITCLEAIDTNPLDVMLFLHAAFTLVD
jgi:hypothetical protein